MSSADRPAATPPVSSPLPFSSSPFSLDYSWNPQTVEITPGATKEVMLTAVLGGTSSSAQVSLEVEESECVQLVTRECTTDEFSRLAYTMKVSATSSESLVLGKCVLRAHVLLDGVRTTLNTLIYVFVVVKTSKEPMAHISWEKAKDDTKEIEVEARSNVESKEKMKEYAADINESIQKLHDLFNDPKNPATNVEKLLGTLRTAEKDAKEQAKLIRGYIREGWQPSDE